MGLVGKNGVIAGLEWLGASRWTAGRYATVAGVVSALAELLPAALLLGWATLRLPDALAFGAGVGAFEVLYVRVLTVRHTPVNTSGPTSSQSEQTYVWLFLLERSLALAGHVASRILVYIAVRHHCLPAALLALVLFSVVDGVAHCGSQAGWRWEKVGVSLRYYGLIALVGLIEVWAAWQFGRAVPEWQGVGEGLEPG